jgi:DNA helicase-2/ATP-dependent DNA helicase PcrA
MTRAREELYMIHAVGRMLYGGQQHNPPSRFLSEINAESVIENSFLQNLGSRQYDEPISNEPVFQPPSDEPRYVPDVSEGDAVKHSVFGTGTIMELDGDVATIYFKGRGAKKINIAFAPIEKI